MRKGFALNLLVLGETGTGKTTFINSLFSADVYDGKDAMGISDRIGQTIHVEKTCLTLVEKGVQVRQIFFPEWGCSFVFFSTNNT